MKQNEIDIGWISKSYRISPCIMDMCDFIESQRLISNNKYNYNEHVLSIFYVALELLKRDKTIYLLENQKRVVKGFVYSPEFYQDFLNLYEQIKCEFPKLTNGQFVESIIITYLKEKNNKAFTRLIRNSKYKKINFKL